jgi:hypothetical protein
MISLDKLVAEYRFSEHMTHKSVSGLFQHYFSLNKFVVTNEQISIFDKRPNFTIAKFNENNELTPHTFAKVKSLVSTNTDGFDDMLDQLGDAIAANGIIPSFAILIKGTKIAFFAYHSFLSILNQYSVMNYKGLIPLTYHMSYNTFVNIMGGNYTDYINRTGIPAHPYLLRSEGVEDSSNIQYPYIFDLLNEKHQRFIHNLFLYVSKYKFNLSIE